LVSAEEQMIRVHAAAHVAAVQDVQASRDLPLKNLPREAVRSLVAVFG
jgi:hypothetical protein